LFTSSLAQASTPGVAPLPADPHPLRFVPNQRQWEKPVLFAADVPAGRLYLERGRLLVARYDAQAVDEQHHHRGAAGAKVKAHAYAVSFVGANPRAEVSGEQPTGEHSNYFLGQDPQRWASNVPAYTDVRYRQLYPGTDLRFYSRGPVMEYDFELAAGADASRIRLRYEGQQALRLQDGALLVETSVGRVTEQRPVAYQVVNGARVPVGCRYVLGAGNTVSFALARYNHALPLVIDPVLVYSSYSGATANLNWGYSACPDTLGNLYSASINFSAGYPTTTGAYDITFNGGNTDVVISKYNPNAPTGQSSLVYATYLGGNDEDRPHSLVVNRAGELVILGSTESTNFPVSASAYDRNLGGVTDLFVAKLSAGGNQLLGATYFGGAAIDGRMATTSNLYNNFGDDYRGDIITDRQNNVYFTSVTRSSDYPTTAGQVYRGNHEAVVTKLNANLTALGWSTFLGGSADDAGYSIQLDSLQQNIYVAGGTVSTNLPSTPGALNASYRGGPADGFVALLNQNTLLPFGVNIQRCTYLGTGSYDQAYFVQLDRRGAVYVLGQTNGTSGANAYPVSAGTYRNAGSRQFIHKLNSGLTASVFSTVIGNGPGSPTSGNPYPHNLSPTAFLVDNCGQIFLSGWGASSIAGMPTTPDALRPTATNSTPVSNDNTFGYLYIMQLSPNARRLVYGTYFGTGTTHVDGGTSRFDKKGVIYQAICVRATSSGSRAPAILTTPNAYARTQVGSNQTSSAAFKMDIVRLDAAFTPAAGGVPGSRQGCAPLTVSFNRANPSNNGTTWDFGNGQTSTQANNVSATYTAPGTYTVRLTAYDSLSCQPSLSSTETIIVQGLPRAALGPDQTICPGSSATLSVGSGVPVAGTTFTWTPATGLNTTSGPMVVATPSATTRYILEATTSAGCLSRDTVLVTVASPPTLSISADRPTALPGEAITFTANSTAPLSNYRWDFGNGQTSQQASPSHAYTTPGTYTVRLQASYATGCPTEASFTVTVATPRDFKHPNIITPNNDGLNDTFQPYVSPEPVSLQVFSRWGRKVFEQENYTDGWGNDPGVAPGLYYYRLSSASGQTWNGWVEVVK